jgi:site-specific DNA-methyltransferase (adenine-specific)
MEINTIINENCLNILSQMPEESVDLVVSDIPYKIIAGGVRVIYQSDECGGIFNKRDYSKTDPQGVLGRGRVIVQTDDNPIGRKCLKKGGNTPSAVKDGKMFEHNEIEFSEWLPLVYKVLKKGTHCYLMINGRNLAELTKQAEKVGFTWQQLLVWKKGNATPNKYYMNACEYILMLSKRPARNIDNMGRKNVIEVNNIIGNKTHPTEKPLSLLKVLIEASSNKGDLVLDMFCGTGSACVSAKELGRNYIGVDIDGGYCKVARERLNRVQSNMF